MPVISAALFARFASRQDDSPAMKADPIHPNAKGYRRIALVTHSLGSRMAARHLQQTPDAPVAAWVAIGSSEALDYSRLKMPVLDLYGENDLPGVLKTARQRGASLRGKRGSTQVMSPRADHFFNGREAQLLNHVREFLDQTVAP